MNIHNMYHEQIHYCKFEDLTVMLQKMPAFWDVVVVLCCSFHKQSLTFQGQQNPSTYQELLTP